MDKIQRRIAIENTALDVKSLIARKFLDNDIDWIKAWYEFDLKWSNETSGYLTIPEDQIEPFVAMARSNSTTFRLAELMAGTRLQHDVALPELLRAMIVDVLIGNLARPPRKKGRKTNRGRDFILIRVMWMLLQEYECLPTRNRVNMGARKREFSASEILVEALKETPIGYMDLERIHRVWGCKKAQAEHDEIWGLYLTSLLDDLDERHRV